MLNKTFLVTGSTDGIGRHTATKLARAGATVLIHGRSKQRVEETVQQIRQDTGSSKLHPYVYDLSSLQAVRQLAQQVRDEHERIDVLINNAGVYEETKKISADGFEYTWAVNVLAPFLLTSLLLDRVQERIVNVSSVSAASSINLDNLQQEKGYSAHDAYSLSKLCNMLFTFKLGDLLQDSNVTVNCLDPGTVNTKMLLAGWGRIGMSVRDANYVYHLATSNAVATETGAYFINNRKTNAPRVAHDKSIQDTVWDIWLQQTGAVWVFGQARRSV